jgi:hypothetical protein
MQQKIKGGLVVPMREVFLLFRTEYLRGFLALLQSIFAELHFQLQKAWALQAL